MQDGGQFAAMVGPNHSDWGREMARTERELCREGLAPVREALLRYRLGTGLFETGDLYRAQRELQRSVELGEAASEPIDLQAGCQYWLGLIHRALGQVEQELVSFREAARSYARLHQEERAVRCQIELAWSLLLAGRTAEALPELHTASAGRRAIDAVQLTTPLALAEALYLSQVGHRDSSDQRCLELLDRPPLQPVQRADIAWILAGNALAAGNRTAAELHIAIAGRHALEAWWPPQVERIDQLRRRLACDGDGSRPSSVRG